MKKNNKKFILVFVLVLFISIGFAFLTTDLSIRGISFIKQNTWDVHFANIVDDSFSSEVNNPATISSNGKKVNFEVTFNNPGEEYYFYVDVVNDGTLDAMLDLYEVTGLSEEQKNYIEWEITYSDGIELTKYDKLTKGEKDTLKVLVRFKDNIDVSVLPNENETLNLTFKSIYVQADKSANERTTVEDKTAPDINFASNSSGTIKGNNKWYKSLSILSKLVDPSGISSAKYCVTTDESCTPDQTTDIKNNSISLQLSNNVLGQTVCVEGIDNKENDDVVCSKEKYYVDGEDPVINSIEVTPADLSMRVELTSKDNHSGVNKYYYSKDGGSTYISSNEPNYTFSSLTAKDYIVMAYVEDVAGNKSSTVTKTTTVHEYSWCEKNGITNLADCAIATEAHNSDIAAAKKEIEDKGQPNFSKTGPTYTYKEKHSSTLTTKFTSSSTFAFGTAYRFNQTTGQYIITSPSLYDISKLNLEDGKIYFSCINGNGSTCPTLYKLDSYKQEENGSYTISKYDYTYDIDNYDVSSIGMYAAEDDLGTSYYYRGSAGGNFVKFADKYWRIIRINGDGSIRLMYFSNTDTENGKNAIYRQFNVNHWDPTYVGYMYNDSDFSESEITSIESNFSNFAENTTYYFGKDYNWDSSAKKFNLIGTVESGDITSGIWKNIYNELLRDGYVYTCFGTSATSSCQVIMHITGYKSVNSAIVQYISHSSTTYVNSTKNVKKSNVLTELETWYKTNLLEKSDSEGNHYSDYLNNTIFCNDRSLSEVTTGDGVNFNPTTHYGAYYRLVTKKSPSYRCPDIERDGFSLKDSSVGNKLLDYPIGTLTADEVAFAGGVSGQINPLYFINYNDNKITWTLSPVYFDCTGRAASEWSVYATGSLHEWASVTNSYGVRPVISLKADTIITGGDGTADKPYTVKLP